MMMFDMNYATVECATDPVANSILLTEVVFVKERLENAVINTSAYSTTKTLINQTDFRTSFRQTIPSIIRLFWGGRVIQFIHARIIHVI